MDWDVEEIPDDATLFMRCHRQWVRPDGPHPNNFQNRGRGMSCDWDKYASPEETRARKGNPDNQAVVSLAVGEVRRLADQSVVHDPLEDNRAHSEVLGEKDDELRIKLARLARWVIEINQPSV